MESFQFISKIESMRGTTLAFDFGLLNLAAVAFGKPNISGNYFFNLCFNGRKA